MIERVTQLEIVRVDYTDAPPWGPAIEQDPDAPSVSEVVEVLKDAKWSAWVNENWPHHNRIDNLIARLEK